VTLVDTSVWIDHLRSSNATLVTLLENGRVSIHPFVIGELACGAIRHRAEFLASLARLDSPPLVSDRDALQFVEHRRLMGRGIGWIDVHLLASTIVARGRLWTLDRRLRGVTLELGVAHA
jgi:hypothetical protein